MAGPEIKTDRAHSLLALLPVIQIITKTKTKTKTKTNTDRAHSMLALLSLIPAWKR